MDLNELAASIAREATGKVRQEKKSQKNQAVVELGRLGGLKGGKVRAERLTPEQRKVIAQKAAKARLGKLSLRA